jgi:hypothetical protein
MPKHTPFLYGRRTCIFCTGHPPDVKITNEHVFADWLRELFPRDSGTTHTHGVIVWPTSAGAPQADPSVWLNPRGHGHSGSKKVRAVCRTCNSEWLSNQVEEVAKPILIPMIAGRSCALNRDMQHRLATWAVKTVMTAEHVNKGKSVIQQSERTWLKDNLTPPAGWFVWAAPYSGANWRDLGIFQHSGKLEIPDIASDTLAHHNLGLTFMALADFSFLCATALGRALGTCLPAQFLTSIGYGRLVQMLSTGRRHMFFLIAKLNISPPISRGLFANLSRLNSKDIQGVESLLGYTP